MSILKDLDPQYAKLHSEPLLRKPVIWSGLALLALGSAYWIATQSATQQASAEAKSTPTQHTSTSPTGTTATKEPSTNFLQEDVKKHALPAMPAMPLAASIREEPPSDQKIAQTTTKESPFRTSLADAEYSRPPQSTPDRTVSAPMQKAEQAKRSHPATQTVAKKKIQEASEKKSSERDIDIITAIVR